MPAHELGGLVIDEIAVLDRAHAAFDGAGDGVGAIGMGADIGLPGLRLADRGADLLQGELQAVERIVGRGDAARDHELDVVGALAQLVAHRTQHLRHAVDDARDQRDAAAAGADVARIRPAAPVAVAAGLGDALPGDEQARPDEMPRLDRLADAPIGAADVAHRGEAAIEHRPHQRRRARRHQGQRDVVEEMEIDLGEIDMDMRVDEPRHHGAPGDVDHRRALAADRRLGDFLDALALDQHVDPLAQIGAVGIEQIAAAKQIETHC